MLLLLPSYQKIKSKESCPKRDPALITIHRVIVLFTVRDTTAALPLLRVILLRTASVTIAAQNQFLLLHQTVTRSVTTSKFMDTTVVKVERVERVDIMEDMVDMVDSVMVEKAERVDTMAVVLTTTPKNVKSFVTKFPTLDYHQLYLVLDVTLEHMIIMNMIT